MVATLSILKMELLIHLNVHEIQLWKKIEKQKGVKS